MRGTTDFPWHQDIQKARKDRRITQQELSEMTGIHQSRISQIETGHGGAKLSEVVAMSEAVGMALVMVPENALESIQAAIIELQRRERRGRSRTVTETILGDRISYEG